MGTSPEVHQNQGFQLLQGAAVFSGPIFGGCIDTVFDMFDGERYADAPILCQKYQLFPTVEQWKGKILLLESSEEKMLPEKYGKALSVLKNTGIFDVINGILVGKPMDETYYEEYKKVLLETINNPRLPIVYNINVGHALPRCIIPFGVPAVVDVQQQKIEFIYE